MKTSSITLFVLIAGMLPHIALTQNIPQPPPTDLDRKIQTFLSASIDLARQRLSGPSYEYTPGLGDLRNHPGDVLALNLAIQFHNKGMINQILDYYDKKSYRRPGPVDPSTLLASNDTLPGPASENGKVPFLRHISFLYGVQLIGKGGKEKDDFGSSKTRMVYLEPMGYALYNHDLPNNKGRLFAGPGLYLAYGLWGKIKYEGQGFSSSDPAFDKDLGYNRFDMGVNGMLGYELPKGISVSLVYELGLINIDPGRGDDKTKNRVLSLNLAYPLRKLVGSKL